MTCTLKILDPTLKFYLGKDTFDTYSDFRQSFENKLSNGFVPIGNKLEPVSYGVQGYSTLDTNFGSLESLMNNVLGGLLETENPDIQFNKFLQTFGIYQNKYQSERVISNEEKQNDSDFLSSLLDFYQNFPVSQDFKESALYGDFLTGADNLRNLVFNNREEDDEPEQPTNESELYEDNLGREPYIYSVAHVYEPTVEPVSVNNDDLAIVRHNFSEEIERLMEQGRQFFVRLEKDSGDNIQTLTLDEISQKKIQWGVVGVVYELVGNEFKRVYIQDAEIKLGGKISITTDPNKSIELGKNNVSGFTLTMPDMTKKLYSSVNEQVKAEFNNLRSVIKSKGEPSPYYKINGVWKEYPVAAKFNKINDTPIKRNSRVISLRQFLDGQKGDLRINVVTDGINYAGNLYVQFPNGKVVLDRKPLSDKWKERVYNLVNHEYNEDLQSVVDALNNLLEFKGGDIQFGKRGNKIIVRRKSKRTLVNGKWVYERIKEEVPLEELMDLLDYARINVNKSYLENPEGTFPIITDKGLKQGLVNWYDFYLDHHETIARQIKIGNEYHFEPIKSLVFDLKSEQSVKVEEVSKKLENPKIGNLEISPDETIETKKVIENLQSIVNETSGSTRDILMILNELLKNEEVLNRLEGSTLKFTTILDAKSKQYGLTRGKEILIAWGILGDVNLMGDVIAHEIIHTLTQNWISSNLDNPLVKELEQLLELAPNTIPEYNRRNIYELLASLSDPEVAKELQKVKIKDKTLYEKLVDFLRDIIDKVFGLEQFKKGQPNLYKELIVKLIEISTTKPAIKKEQKEPDIWEGLDLNNLGYDVDPLSTLGYNEESLKVALGGEKKSFIDQVIKSIDTDLFLYINKNNLLPKFISGELDFTTIYRNLFNEYLAYIKNNKESISNEEKKFLTFLLKNRDFVEEYWLENTEAVKVRKPKKGEKDKGTQVQDVVDPNDSDDPTEVLEGENEEKQQEISEITGGEEVNEGREIFERTGTEISSIDGADKVVRLFVKMLPKIERKRNKTVLYSEEEVNKLSNKDEFLKVGSNYIKYQRNTIGRFELCDYTSTWNLIAMELANKLSLEEMIEHIDNHPELVNKIPEIFIFRDRLKKNIENEFDADLYSKIETSFKRASVGVWVLLDNNGTLSLINESADYSQTAKRLFNSSLVNSLQDSLNKYYLEESGEFMAKKWLTDLGVLVNGEYKEGKDVLKSMGLELNPKTIYNNGVSGNKTQEYINFEREFVLFLSKFDKVPVTLADFIIKGTKQVEGLNNYFKKLFELENKNNPLSTTTMVTNAEGEKQSTLSVFNSILQYRKHYNDAQTLEELQELIPRTKNDLFNYSLTKNTLFPIIVDEEGNEEVRRSKVNVLVDILSGWKTVITGRASEGNLTIDLETGDWIRLNFVSLIKNGLIENTRAETASTSYAFKLTNWDAYSSIPKLTPFSIGEVIEIFSVKDNKPNLGVNSKIYQVWSNYLKGELTRIKKQKEAGLDKKGKFGLFQNILNDTEQKTLLEQLNKDVDSIVKINQDLIINALNRFFKEQYDEFNILFETEMGGMSTIASSYGDEIIGDTDLFNKIVKPDKLNQYKLFFVLNTLTLHTEETILFQGDLSETPKYFKRAKGVQSTGTPLSKSEQLQNWVNKSLEKFSFGSILGVGTYVGKTYESATIADDVKESHYTKTNQLQKDYVTSKKKHNEFKGITQSDEELEEEAQKLLTPEKKGVKEGYAQTNIGDGDGFISPDYYFSLLNLVGNINQDQIIAFKALVLDAKKNAKKYGLGKNQELTKEEEEIVKEGFELISKGKVVFPKLKVTQRGNINAKGNIIQKEVMDKFALFPLFPQFVYDKPAAKAAMLGMMKNGIGYIKFESGTKIDNNRVTDFLNRVENGELEINFEDSKHTLQSEYLREQIKTPHKVKDKNTFGTQFRKLITSINDLVTRKKWEKLNQDFSEQVKKEILNELGITKVNGVWNFSNVRKDKVAKVLLEESKRRELPDNLKVYFDKYRKNKVAKYKQEDFEDAYEYFETSFGSQQIQSLLASIIKKISIQKLKGAQLVQVSQSLFDRSIKVGDKTRDLGFYHIKDDKVQAAECKIAMMGDFRNLLNLEDVVKLVDPSNDNELTRTEALNKLLQDDKWVEEHEKQLTVIGYRIPTQGFNSMEVMVILEFLPAFHGNTIVCPPEITTQSGTDYDYDKLSVILPSIGKNGELMTDKSYGIQNEMIQTAKEMLLSVENFHKLVTPNTNELIFGLLKEEKGLLAKIGISSEDPKFTKIITFLGNLKKFKAVKGKNLLGIAAVWNPFTVLIQNHKWALNPKYIKEIGFGKKKVNVEVDINPVLGGSLNSSEATTKNGTSKLEIISQLINVTVDMPSDDTFGQTIFTKDDFGALTYSISMLGYDLDTALKFFHQPVVYKFKDLVSKNVRAGHSKYTAKLQALADILGMDIPMSDNGPNFTKFETSLYDKLNDLELEIDISKFDTGLENVPNFRTVDYSKSQNQKAVLAHYFKLLDQASTIRSVQSSLNFDTSPDNNLQKTFARKEHRLKAINSNIVDQSMIDEVKNNSVISGLYVSDILESFADELFPILFSGLNKERFLEVSNEYGQKSEKAFQQITNDFLLSIIQNFGEYGEKNKNLYDIAEQYLTGDKKLRIIRKAKKLKEKFSKEGLSYKLLDSLLLDLSKERSPVIFNPQVYLGLENSPEHKNKLTEEWKELLNSNDPEIQRFAQVLGIVGLVQSGWGKSPIYFSDIIPEEFTSPIISNAFDKYQNLSEDEKKAYLNKFVENFKYNESRTLGRKSKDYLREPFRLMNYKNGVQETLDSVKPVDTKITIENASLSLSNLENKGSLPMQPDNIEMIKSGRKTQTIRTQKFEDGIYTLPDGTKVELITLGQYTVQLNALNTAPSIVGKEIAGIKGIGEMYIPLDEFAQAEGFKDWKDFVKNNKFSSGFISGGESRYVYSIKPVVEQSQPKTYKGQITKLEPNQIFVFGSNTEGRHGKGAALIAKEKFGAKYGQAEGLQGQSYAIITKDLTKSQHPSRTKEQIQEQISRLYSFANDNKDKEFLIAYSGEGKNLNAYSPQEMADMFSAFPIPNNIIFEQGFNELITRIQPKDGYLDFVGTLSQPKTQDEFKYYGAMYTIELKDGKAVDVVNLKQSESETNKKFQERKNKIINAYNTNPNVDPQNGKPFRTIEQPIESSVIAKNEETFFKFKDGFQVPTKFSLNQEQRDALYKAEEFFQSSEKTLTLSGAAGTGKSTLVSILNTWLERKKYIYPKYSAPTHRANSVTKLMNPNVSVYTLHSLFGLSPDLDLETGNFDVKQLEFAQQNKMKIDRGDILIIDESSMISDSLFDFIQKYQESLNLRVLYVGDVEQLKPVKQKTKSKVFTSTEHQVLTLNKVERTGDNAVLEEATNIRNGKDWNYETKMKNGQGVIYLKDRAELLQIAKDNFEQQNNSDNKLYFRILSATNSAVSEINTAIRKVLFPNNDAQIVQGDIIMGYDNFDYDYKSGQYKLYNGGDYQVTKVSNLVEKHIDEINETFKGYQVTLNNLLEKDSKPYTVFVVDNSENESKAWKFADYIQQLQIKATKAMKHSPQEGAQLFSLATAMKKQIAFMKDISKMDTTDSKPKVVIRKTFDYGYAHTIHKSQGGTYDRVMILADTIAAPFDPNTQQELKYVAVSRARNIAYVKTNHPIKTQPVEQTQQQTTVDKSLSWSELENLPVYSDKGIMVMRKQGTHEHFGNPFTGSGIQGSVQTKDVPTAVQAYKDWLTDDYVLYETKEGTVKEISEGFKKEQRDWILSQIEQGKLDGKKLLYMKDKGEYYSHADALAEMVNTRKTTKQTKQTDMSQLVDHSGGAPGGDTFWDIIGRLFGVTNHKHYTVNFYDSLSQSEKEQLNKQYIDAANFLQRGKLASDTYAGKLVRRDMIQANNGDAIFGVTELVKPGIKGRKGYENKNKYSIPEGGTGYAVARGILLNKPVYVFNQSSEYGNEQGWYKWDSNVNDFVKTDVPTLTKNFTGIGTTKINEQGKQAIRDVYQKTLEQGVQEVSVQTAKPENLWSGSNDPFAAALTNPTTIAKRKGKINKDYPITFRGKTYVDAEVAYKQNKVDDLVLAKQGKIDPRNNDLMVEILIAKLNQYPGLITELNKRGGVQWLEQSEHTVNGNRFEGKGRQSPFINNLIKAYELVLEGKTPGQLSLFAEKTDNQLINDYVTRITTGEVTPDWMKLKTPVNLDNLRKNQNISELVQKIKNRISELQLKLDEYEKDPSNKDAILSVTNQIQGYGSLVYDLENLRPKRTLGYNQESLNTDQNKRCTSI